MSINKTKIKNKINPEIQREVDEKRRSANLYDDDDEFGGIMLYPDYFLANAASGTEATGLIQTPPTTAAEIQAYHSLYNYYKDNNTVFTGPQEDD